MVVGAVPMQKSRRSSLLPAALLVTCEHARCSVPAQLASLFAGHQGLLSSHRGSDLGALPLARQMAGATGAPLLLGRWTRLMVDLNRSVGHPAVFSEIMAPLSRSLRQAVLTRYYWPYQRAVLAQINPYIARGQRVIHVSVHSFTPVWRGATRRVDVGLLFDASRVAEAAFCRRWQAALKVRCPTWRVRRNNPYRGTADGLTTRLRRTLPARLYLGIEVEMNQAMTALPGPQFGRCRDHIVATFLQVYGAKRHIEAASGRGAQKLF